MIFALYFENPPRPVVDVWDTLVAFLREQKFLPKEFRLSQIAGHLEGEQSEKDLTADYAEVRRCIIERNLDAFAVSSGRGERVDRFRLLPIGGKIAGAVLTTTLGEKSKSPTSWMKFIEGVMLQWPAIMASQWSVDYASWQNTNEIRFYESLYGPIPPSAKRISIPKNGVSPAREVFDISKNPGRYRQLIPGSYFRPNAEMWLGPHFWQFAKCSKEEVLAADFFLEVRDTPHFLYLKSWPHSFTRPDGEQGRIQQKLWKLLFHEDCEWPPGSGGISDEPMYGPPELMPGNSGIS